MTLTAYVTSKTPNGGSREDTFHCLNNGVKVDRSGALHLVSEMDSFGNIKDGHIIAHGEWREVNLQTEED